MAYKGAETEKRTNVAKNKKKKKEKCTKQNIRITTYKYYCLLSWLCIGSWGTSSTYSDRVFFLTPTSLMNAKCNFIPNSKIVLPYELEPPCFDFTISTMSVFELKLIILPITFHLKPNQLFVTYPGLSNNGKAQVAIHIYICNPLCEYF